MSRTWESFPCIVLLTLVSLTTGDLTKKNHLTHKASEKPNDLSCYVCHTMEDGDRCINLTPLGTNFSILPPSNSLPPPSGGKNFIQQCKEDKRICMIKRYSYTTSTENSTSKPELWAMERNCSSKCEPGCIIIGERVKLYACTACCENTLCNNGTGSSPRIAPRAFVVFVINAVGLVAVRVVT